ncbi:hypothetical protein [Thalassobacillus sp. CUG 92003]|uniref:hypothetical protein n=1 Tax=Thalassobacillus sp. CUG 92003 TaxID=2736641 RepID=UPI0015E71578|nr:hypothetical protein [Thalassobacillus sp. CUG 92003]
MISYFIVTEIEIITETKRIQEDLNYLVYEAEGSLFGENRNPLQPFYGPKRNNHDGIAVRKRRTCCSYYEVCDGEKYCSVCPKRPKI